MADIVDLNIYPTIETVDVTIQTIIDNVAVTIQPTNNPVNLTITPNLITINVNQVTGGGAVNSVNTLVGDVVLTQDTVLDGSTFKQYSLTEKNKLAGIATGAEVNVNADWNATTGDALILNKPTIPDGTTLVPYSGAVSDVNLGEFGLLTGNIEFDNTPTNIPTAAGSMYYNDTDGTLDLKLKGGNVTLQIGQEQVIRVVNKTATNITLLEANYQAVRLTGAQGQRMKVDLAQATSDPLSAETIGLVTETIANNQEGFVTTSGLVRGINTTGSLQSETWADGDLLYLSPTIAGRITKVKPTAPNHLIIIGYVVHAHITQGSIFVKVDNGYELDELHNVKITTAANNNILAYTSATDIWENKTVETALGFTPANDSNVVHLAQIETITGQKTFNPSVTAAAAIARGTNLTPTLVASANSDVLVGLDIAPTFTNGAFTSLSNYGIRHAGDIVPSISNSYNLGAQGTPYATIYTRILRDLTQISYRSDNQGWFNNANTQTAKLFSTGNLILQNGGTFTDLASSRLTVNSTTQGFLPPRMTTTQRNAIASPATGLLVYDTTLLSEFQYNGTAWVSNTLGYTPYRFTKTTEIVHTGVLTETILQTIFIPANTFSNGDFIMFSALVSKLANISNTTHNIKINTTNTLVGATSIALVGFNNVNFSMKFKREMVVNSGNIYVLNVSSATTNDDTSNATATVINSFTYNLSADLYFFVTCSLSNTADTITYRGINFYKQ